MSCCLHDVAVNAPSASKEQGSVLIISLVLLVVLAALATSAITSATLEQRMSVNSLEQNVAFQSAETGLKSGEAILQALLPSTPAAITLGTAGCAAPCITTLDNVNGGIYANATGLPWGNFAAFPEIGTVIGTSSGAPPQYIVEYVGFFVDPNSSLRVDSGVVLGSQYYRVTAMGIGRTNVAGAANAGAQSVLQSIYARRLM
ncbi:MAG TPA: PilX N-terminal domain-containing pilus assembly protein [Mariprofundaceae bacterium]|nr:PilX N-terminal domain-containing pilus assembly protein [Mariprofundaceae bacterium]